MPAGVSVTLTELPKETESKRSACTGPTMKSVDAVVECGDRTKKMEHETLFGLKPTKNAEVCHRLSDSLVYSSIFPGRRQNLDPNM